MTYLIKGFSTRLEDDYPNLLTTEERTSMTIPCTPETRQNQRRGRMIKTATSQTYVLTNAGTGDAAMIRVTEEYRPMKATVEAWSAQHQHDMAAHYNIIASATLTMQEGDSINSYTRRVHEQAAILGMDTLRELAKPLYREPPTAGES